VLSRHGSEATKVWAAEAIQLHTRSSAELIAAVKGDGVELQFFQPAHPVRLVMQAASMAYERRVDSSAVQTSQVATWSSLAMKEGENLTALRTRVEDINKTAEPAERVSEIKCGAFFLLAMANSTWAPAKKCAAEVQKQKRLSGWKEEDLTLAFLEQKAQDCWPESVPGEDDKGKSKKKQQQAGAGDGEDGPAAVSGGANDVKNQSQNPKWKGRGKDGSTGGGGGGGGGKEGPTCFVCGKAGHKFRDMNKTNGKRYHTEEEIRKAQDGAKLRAGFGSGGGKGAIARSGGAAEGSAPQMFAGMSREEIAFRVAQEKAAMTEAYLRWQESKVSGPAAAADSNGGFGF